MSRALQASRRRSRIRYDLLRHEWIAVTVLTVIAAALASLLLWLTTLEGPAGLGLYRLPLIP